MTEKLLRLVRALVAVIGVLSGVLLVASVALNFANVVGRYFFNASIPWAEEAMLFLMVGCVFLGNGVVAWSGRQIRMDVVVRMLPPKVREALDLFSELVFLITAVAIVIFAWPVIRDLAEFDQRSQAADFPLVIPQAMVPIDHGIPRCRAPAGPAVAPQVSNPRSLKNAGRGESRKHN
jgi:TRAP-type C4-dicarboxylate transport system permease small subunit